MQMCLRLPENCSLRASRFQERASELFFSMAKKDYRGNPSCRDGILGVHKTHLSQLRENIAPPEVKHDVVSLEQAQRLHAEAFTMTCLFQSWISVGTTRAVVASNFELWYRTEGKKLILGAAGSQDDDAEDQPAEESDDEELAIDLGVHEDLPREEKTVDESQAELIATLHAVEDHKSMKESLQALANSEPADKPKDATMGQPAALQLWEEEDCQSWRKNAAAVVRLGGDGHDRCQLLPGLPGPHLLHAARDSGLHSIDQAAGRPAQQGADPWANQRAVTVAQLAARIGGGSRGHLWNAAAGKPGLLHGSRWLPRHCKRRMSRALQRETAS